jgi:leucyl aminopeptidase
MKLDVVARPIADLAVPLLALPWPQGADGSAQRPGPDLDTLGEAVRRALERALESGDFRARRGELLLLYREPNEAGPERVLLVGLGAAEDLSAERLREAGGRAARRAGELGLQALAVAVSPDRLAGRVELAAAVQAAVEGVVLGAWRFEELRTEPPEDDGRPPLESLTVSVPSGDVLAEVTEAAEVGERVAAAQNYARELTTRPGNIVTPAYLGEEAGRLAEELGLRAKVLDAAAIRAERMGALLAVAAGSDQEPRFIVLEYEGAGDARPLVLVGKGVTFDSGGLSLKTAQGMESMKHDMSGAAAVLGTLRVIAGAGLPVRLVGLIPAVENLPSGRALKPGDVITSRSGVTIEVTNTDAEGRLILADALDCALGYDPEALVDIATLTGACVVALGHEASGLMGSDERLIAELRAAGERSGERAWPLPLWPEYRELLKSEVADLKNSGGRAAGAISAAMFLRRFVGGAAWAHVDIAGTAWAEKAGPYQPVGPTGVGVRLLTEWVRGRVG